MPLVVLHLIVFLVALFASFAWCNTYRREKAEMERDEEDSKRRWEQHRRNYRVFSRTDRSSAA